MDELQNIFAKFTTNTRVRPIQLTPTRFYALADMMIGKEQEALEDYLKAQNRFRHLTDDQVKYIQAETDTKRERLLERDGKRIIF